MIFFFSNAKHNVVITSIAGPCDETLKQSQGGILIGLYLVTVYVFFLPCLLVNLTMSARMSLKKTEKMHGMMHSVFS